MHRFKTKAGKIAKKMTVTIIAEDFEELRTLINSLADLSIGLNHENKSQLGRRVEDIAEDLKTLFSYNNITKEDIL